MLVGMHWRILSIFPLQLIKHSLKPLATRTTNKMSNFSYDLRLEKLETHNIFIRMYIDDLQFQNNQLKIEINVLKGFIQDHCYYLHGEGSVIGPDIYTTHIKLPKNDFDICKNRFTGEFLGDDSMVIILFISGFVYKLWVYMTFDWLYTMKSLFGLPIFLILTKPRIVT